MTGLKLVLRLLGACCLAAAMTACADTPGSSPLALQDGSVGGEGLQVVQSLPPPANSGNGTEQPLSASDVLEVQVLQAPTLNRTVQIDSTGKISLPLIGTVQAAGKTARGLEREIAASYGRSHLQNPDVTVFVKESAGQRVTVDGEVKKPGLLPITANTRLLDVIAQSGGFTNIADEDKIYVFRDIGGQKLVANYSVATIRSGKSANPRIYGGDVVIVFTSQGRVAFNNLKEALGVATSVGRFGI